jgi:hypothetical protein
MTDNGVPGAAAPEPAPLRRLRGHFGCEPATLPVLEQSFELYERPNLHLALEELLSEPRRQAELVGMVALQHYSMPTLAHLSREKSAAAFDEGPVEYVDVGLPDDRQLACVKQGLYLVHEDGRPLALLVREDHPFRSRGIAAEVLGTERDRAERFLRQLSRMTHHGRAFRDHVLSLEEDCHGSLSVHYHHLPHITREDLILPAPVLQRIERDTISFSRHADKLRAAGRHLKRGVLLHGPPGTGKTLSAMYLVSQMPGRTVLLLTGAAMRSIEAACRMARMLTPATIILEDVDLVGTERQQQTVGANALLFDLLNEMDGLSDDADLLFILTTNRPEILEPALAARPGRIDQAIEILPPDADCRRRLFALYGRGLQLEVNNWQGLIDRTAGVSGAFIRELLRKAAVFAAEEGGNSPLSVRDAHLEEALVELLVAGGPLTQSLLGVKGSAGQRKPAEVG